MNVEPIQAPDVSGHGILIVDLYDEVSSSLEYSLRFMGNEARIAKTPETARAEMHSPINSRP